MAATTISRTEQIRAGTAFKWITNNGSGVLQESTVTGLRAVASDANGLPVASTSTAAQLNFLQGLVGLVIGDIISVNGGGNLADAGIAAANLFLADGSVTATGTFNLGTHLISNLADPVSLQDAATKNYVDSVAAGLSPKGASRAATTGALPAVTSSGGGVGATLTANANGTIPAQDGVTLVNGDRLLVKNQAAPVQNGIYVVTTIGSGGSPFILTRATDFDGSAGAGVVEGGSFTFVTSGTTQGGTGWSVVHVGVVTVGTDPINFTQTSSAVTYSAGAGLDLTGTVFSISTDNSLVAATGGSVPSLTVQNSLTGAIITAADGLAVQLEAVNPTLQIDGSNELGAKLNNAGAIVTGASGLTINVDNITIDIAANKIEVKTGGIADAQISASAAIAFSKLAPLTSGNILVGNGANVAASVAMSGDVTISNTGVTSIAGGLSTHFVTREIPAGTIDGTNVTFTLANTPVVGSEMVFLNGLLNQSGGANDYTISGAVITYNTAPSIGDRILVSYQK